MHVISQEVIGRADAVVYVPTVGCMNLAATVNVVLYDRLTKSSQCFEGNESNELIRQNRDTNNRVKVTTASSRRSLSIPSMESSR